jgi:hypothetical protein
MPCNKTLRKWAKARFNQWLQHDPTSGTLQWEQHKSKFTSQQIIAWFAFKDEKYQEAVKTMGAGAEATIDRTTFGCCKKYHRDPEFSSIFQCQRANVVGTKKQIKVIIERYIKELRLSVLPFRCFRIPF